MAREAATAASPPSCSLQRAVVSGDPGCYSQPAPARPSCCRAPRAPDERSATVPSQTREQHCLEQLRPLRWAAETPACQCFQGVLGNGLGGLDEQVVWSNFFHVN